MFSLPPLLTAVAVWACVDSAASTAGRELALAVHAGPLAREHERAVGQVAGPGGHAAPPSVWYV